MYDIFTHDGRIQRTELDVETNCGVWSDKRLLFVMDPENFYFDNQKTCIQPVWEGSLTPLMMRTKHPVDRGALVDQIWAEAHAQAKLNVYLNAAKNVLMDKILWIIAIPCCAFVLIFGIQMVFGKK